MLGRLSLSTTSAIALLAFGTIGQGSAAHAQTGGSQVGALEEVVVTARKREENLMEVPMSITAVSAENMAADSIKDPRDLAQFTPGLFVSYSISGQSIARALTFRGLNVSNGGQLFIDGAPYVGQANPDLGALERVEVLLGPQSAYFGRSTFTGALNYVTKNPSMDGFKGSVSAEYASYNQNDETISLEGPLVADKLAVRITAHHFSVGGMWTNNSDPNSDVGSVKKDTVSGVFLFTPNDNLKAKVFIDYSLDNDGLEPAVALSAFNYNGTPATQYASRQLNCNLGGTFGPWWCGPLPSASHLGPLNQPGTANIISWYDTVNPQINSILLHNSRNLEPTEFNPTWINHFGIKQQAEAAHANIDYTTASGWAFSSVTALHYTKYEGLIQPDYRDSSSIPNTNPGQILPWIGFYNLFEQKTWDGSQEFRVTSPQQARLRATAGANYLASATPGNDNYGIAPAGTSVSGTLTTTHTSTPAVFGGVYYDILPKLTLGGEARYQWDTISAITKFPVPPAASAGLLKATYGSFSPRVTLDYNLEPGSVIYALWSRGYRPGGFNTQVLGQPASVLAALNANVGVNVDFQQEKLDNFEGGFKNTWLDGRIQTAIGGYFDEWRNGQVTNTITVQTPTGVQQISATQNVGAVNLYGIEATAAAAVTNHLTVTGNADYVHSKILAYIYTPNGTRIDGSTNVNGNQFFGAPVGWTFTITPQYTDHLVGDWDWFTRVDYKHRGRFYPDATNVDWIPSNNIFDIHAGVKDKNLKIEAFVLNLTKSYNFQTGEVGADATCCAFGASTVNEIRLLLPQKRQFGIRGTYDF